tara:strand:+ start:232 stop:582 length:351 start_codon:yes stop_codon:yes gene_type:complete
MIDGYKYKIIAKNFDDFKKIIGSTEKREVLLGGNWFQRFMLSVSSGEPVLENDSIKITFCYDILILDWGEFDYTAEFVRNIDTNEILIKNSIIGYYWFFFVNRRISKRILKNWEKA